jgi:hypothetical protein
MNKFIFQLHTILIFEKSLLYLWAFIKNTINLISYQATQRSWTKSFSVVAPCYFVGRVPHLPPTLKIQNHISQNGSLGPPIAVVTCSVLATMSGWTKGVGTGIRFRSVDFGTAG